MAMMREQGRDMGDDKSPTKPPTIRHGKPTFGVDTSPGAPCILAGTAHRGGGRSCSLPVFHRIQLIVFLWIIPFIGGCTTTDTTIDASVAEFSNGVNALIHAGMPWKEAHRVIRERFPRPKADMESAPLVYSKVLSGRTRRFTMMWDTRTPGTSLVLTVECDREMNVARWSTGPLFETK